MQNILSVNNIHYTYNDGTQALKGISFDVKKNEKLAILGANGSGKSTLFLCLNGVLKINSGDITVKGEPLIYKKQSLLHCKKNVGIVFQDPETQLFCINVYQEVAFGPANLGQKGTELKENVQKCMEYTDVDGFQNKPAHLLSGGQKKRVSIASVLSMHPEIIIFDEPTSALDPIHRKQILHLLDKLHNKGITIIMSTHDIDFAYKWAERIIVLHNGNICCEDTPENIFKNEKNINDWGLDMPFVLRVYNHMKVLNLLPSTVKHSPRSIEELLDIMQYIKT